ncbi:MAG: hypothetical protein ABI602_03090, partial [Candidatus Saccharibacteria bacterium]
VIVLPSTVTPLTNTSTPGQPSSVTLSPTPSSTVTVAEVSTPQVLGASTTTPETNSGQVKGAETTSPSIAKLATIDASTKKNSNFLGLGWWWLAVLAAIVGFGLLLSRFINSDKKA